MIHALILTCFCLLVGVFGDEVKSETLSVMEGESVTLHTNITKLKGTDYLEWWFEETSIAKFKSSDTNNIHNDNDKRFRDRLEINNQNADLTIINIRSEHTGNYEFIINAETTVKKFTLTAYAPLPVPIITSDKSHCAISKCSLLCSVMNVRDVTLSWYKGNSLLSSISVSDPYIRLFLPLEVDYQDNNTYRCVVNNPITNQTQHYCLSNLCQPCSVVVPSCDFAVIWLKIQLAVSALMVVGGVTILVYDIKPSKSKPKRKSQTAKSDE
ncbi:CD48 antigen-like [Paramisgurnus dabryanus]|uniref:CD48 antigen-like n=1 Tax=Paramisgurnus dabryanus TaxID=90735 RepID=UPI0031F3F7F3